jgi:hypothetical protein
MSVTMTGVLMYTNVFLEQQLLNTCRYYQEMNFFR